MTGWRILLTLLVMLLMPLAAVAAPAGKVIIAQGVDPTTLDTMNQSETPASNLAINIWDTLVERDPTLKLVPALATELPRNVAPTVWEVKLRKGVRFTNGEDFRSEEHTSELQSHSEISYAVFCLKKKK